ncbi:MAG: OB-fold nucleic acid binding domain-containing protein, partial [Candidatus Aenigmatarchaeota archaeon]
MKIDDILEGKFNDKTVELNGWVYRHRAGKDIVFVVLRDSTGTIQCVLKKDQIGEELFEKVSNLRVESSVKIKGKVNEDDRAPEGYEIECEDLDIIHLADRFPITKDKSTEFLLDVRHLWIRSQKMNKILKVKNTLLKSLREWLENNEFYEVNPPIITSSACEGGTTLFETDYFGDKAYLSQSG